MKPGNWWRAQNSCIDNAKLILLNDRAHRNWFNLMCLASDNNGVLPDMKIMAVKMRVPASRVATGLAELVGAGLFDKREDGSFVPHDWDVWQFKSDGRDPTNAQRQREFRKRQDLLRNEIRGALRNGVTNVSAKRPDTEQIINTTSYREDRHRAASGDAASPEPAMSEAVAAILKRAK